jgi:hypothetical protein
MCWYYAFSKHFCIQDVDKGADRIKFAIIISRLMYTNEKVKQTIACYNIERCQKSACSGHNLINIYLHGLKKTVNNI